MSDSEVAAARAEVVESGAASRAREPRRFGRRLTIELIIAAIVLSYAVTQGTGFILFVVSITLTFVIAAFGMNIVVGWSGQISLGNAVFMGTGAYAVAVGAANGVPFWVSVLMGVILGAVAGFIVGIPAIRFEHIYLAIATLAFTLLFTQILVLWRDVTNGSVGLPYSGGIPLGFTRVTSGPSLVILLLAIVVIVLLAGQRLVSSKYGRAWLALRANEHAALSTGIHVQRYRLMAFVLSAVICAFAGAFHVTVLAYAEPYVYGEFLSIWLLVMVVVGGQASIRGSIYGAVYITALPEVLRFFNLARTHLVVLGVTLLLILYFAPDGMGGRWRRAVSN